MSVDLPAPLSPTSAVTCPAQASRSTPLRTCTAPKLFWIPRRLSSGAVLVVPVDSVMLPHSWDRRPRPAGMVGAGCSAPAVDGDGPLEAGGRTRAGPAPGVTECLS